MSIHNLLIHEITVVVPAWTEDRYGNREKDWTNATRFTTAGRMAQRSRTEIRGHQETDVTDWICYLGPDAAVGPLDRLEWNGNTYEIAGQPNYAYGRHSLHHVEVPCDRVEG